MSAPAIARPAPPLTSPPPRRLSLGCGRDVRIGWVNLDITPLPGVHVVHDLDVFPWPFADGSFDEIECIDILEHLDDLPRAMREIHRILAPGGRVHIEGPHFTSYTVPTDPTHRRAFAINTFEFFTERSFLGARVLLRLLLRPRRGAHRPLPEGRLPAVELDPREPCQPPPAHADVLRGDLPGARLPRAQGRRRARAMNAGGEGPDR